MDEQDPLDTLIKFTPRTEKKLICMEESEAKKLFAERDRLKAQLEQAEVALEVIANDCDCCLHRDTAKAALANLRGEK